MFNCLSSPTPVLAWKSPYEILMKKSPCFDDLRIIGCLCFALNDERLKDKFGSKAKRCIMLGYPYGQKGYKLYYLDNHLVFVSMDVKVFEDKFPFRNSTSQTYISSDSPSSTSLVNPADHCDIIPSYPLPPTSSSS